MSSGSFAGQKTWPLLKERDLGAEPPEALRELDADRTATDDHDARRRTVELEDRLAREEPRLLESRNRRNRRAASGCEQDEPALELALTHADGIRPGQPGRARHDLDAHLLEALRTVVGGGDVFADGVDPLPDPCRVDFRVDRGQAEPICRPHVVSNLRGGQQRLAGHAARPQAVAADAVAFDGGYAQIELSSEHRRCPTAGTHTDNDQIVWLRHGDPPPRRNRTLPRRYE